MSDAPNQTRDEKRGAHLREWYDRYSGEFHAVGSEAATAVARRLHGAMDEVLDRERKARADSSGIMCRKGCANCCHGPVEIWPQEAVLLVEAAREAGIEMDPARLERQSRYAADDWRRQPAADRACVFLGDDGACKIYESRPNACRKHLVVTDPALCDGDKHPLTSVGRWFSWEAEMMECAALDVLGRVLMPRALLDALKARDK